MRTEKIKTLKIIHFAICAGMQLEALKRCPDADGETLGNAKNHRVELKTNY
jgi:hypothetical protein